MIKSSLFKKANAIVLAFSMILGTPVISTVRGDEESGDGYVYVTMNVPYKDFYESYNVTDAAYWEVEDGVDAVSTATTNKFKGTTGLAKGTYNNDKYIMGVTIPVAIKAEEIDQVQTSSDNAYEYTVLESKPDYYSVLTINESGEYEFSKMQDTGYSKEYLGIDGLTLSGRYGDYQVNLNGFNLKEPAGIKVGTEEYIPFTIYGVIFRTSDSESFGMTCLENLWFATKSQYVEVAWSVKNGQGLKRGHGQGGEFYQFDMNGATITGVDVITDSGVFAVPCEINLPKYYEGDTSGLVITANSNATLRVDGVPNDLENVRVSVSGGLASNAEIVNGTVALASEMTDGVSYTVTISSSNYANITRTVATPISENQINELEKWISKGEAILENADNEELRNIVQSAKTMAAEKVASSVEASNMIKNIKAAVKNNYEKYEIAASLVGNKLSIEMDKELQELENPTYSLSYTQGRMTTVLSEGNLAELIIALDEVPAVETKCKLTVVCDNYQDAVVEVVAKEETNEEETTVEETTPEETTAEETTTEKTTPVETTTRETTTQKEKVTQAEKTTSKEVRIGKAAIKKINKKKRSAKKLSLVLKKVSDVNGYEVRIYKSKKDAKNDKAAIFTKTTSKLNLKISSKKIKGKKNLFVKVRAFKIVNSTNKYGSWSTIKKVPVK
ncbi:MAG: hypothetical protein E7254_11850 [Lachnospiraceae bacterium]|nr:hypothetical protein [Lachnospiraceae bacterium]